MKNIFSWDLFRQALERKGLNTSTFHDATKISPGTISAWKTVKSIKKIEHRKALEDVLEVKYDDLCVPSVKDSPESISTVIVSKDLRLSDQHKTKLWPIIGRAAGGPWIEALETSEFTTYAESYMSVSSKYEDKNGYALTVVGNSMEPVLPEGTEIAVSPNRPARNGDVAVVFVQSDISDQAEVCVKRFYFNGANNDKV